MGGLKVGMSKLFSLEKSSALSKIEKINKSNNILKSSPLVCKLIYSGH